MINVSTVMEQILNWFEDDSELSQFRISRGEFINNDAGQAVNGWLGIYRRSVAYDPRNLGISPNNYEGTVVFDLVVQRTSMKSGADCEDILEESVKEILDRLVQIPKDYIDFFSDISVEYTYLESDRKTMYFQGALIEVTAQISFEVT